MADLTQWNEGGHAIYGATFVIVLSPMPPPATMRELLSLHGKVKDNYPRKQETRGIGVRVGIDEQQNAVTEFGVGEQTMRGFTFDSLKPDGQLARAIRLDPMPPDSVALSVLRSDYQRWNQTWGEVRSIFELMLPTLSSEAQIVGLQLQFHDRFLWSGQPDDFRPEMLLRQDSDFLAPNIFKAIGPWHSHHGYFEQRREPMPHNLLNVAEVQATAGDASHPDLEFGFLFDVKLTHRITIAANDQELGNLKRIDAFMEEMHDQDKWVLARILNDEMCDLIELPKPE